MVTFLWRLDGNVEEVRAERWQQGLTLHLLFQPLTTIIARRDGTTRRYLALNGCPNCRPDGCDKLCHRMLFAQLIRTALPGVTLTPAPQLALRSSETRQVVARACRSDAELLDGAFLAQWSEGLLVTTWSRLRASDQPIAVGVRLSVGSDGPDPARELEAMGWRKQPLAALLNRRARTAAIPPPVAGGARASEALFVALCNPDRFAGPQRPTAGQA